MSHSVTIACNATTDLTRTDGESVARLQHIVNGEQGVSLSAYRVQSGAMIVGQDSYATHRIRLSSARIGVAYVNGSSCAERTITMTKVAERASGSQRRMVDAGVRRACASGASPRLATRYDRRRQGHGEGSVGEDEGRGSVTVAQAAAMLGISENTVKGAIKRGVIAVERPSPRLNLVPLTEIEKYRRERLGQRGGYRPGAGRRPTHEPDATMGEEGQSVE